MRLEKLYLVDIVEAADAIAEFLKGIDREAFLSSDLVRSAVLQKLIVIGEAAARLPSDFCAGHPDIPWPDIVAFRNIAVHEYFAIEWPIVWVAATKDAPPLRQQVQKTLTDSFGPDTEGKEPHAPDEPS